MAGSIFSDSWFRISGLRVALLPSVEVSTQTFRGRTWHVLQDRYSQRFFRASAQAAHFILQLNLTQSVEEVWDSFVTSHPESAPSREEVIQLLSQLHMSNLLYSLEHADNEAIVKRHKKQRRKEVANVISSFLFIRVPIWNPNSFLNRIQTLIGYCTGWTAFFVWLMVIIFGVAMAFEHRHALQDQSQGVLSVGNLPWLYVCMAGLKLLHEFGHAFVCKRFGGEVRVLGLMFLIFTPLPYVDATSSWQFTNRWHRIYVSFAGMAIDFFFAALGAIVWAYTGPGLINSLAFNIMLIGSISSVLFNGNPLLRFDAYYMLSDLAEIPNLYQNSQKQWQYLGDRYLLGTVTAESPASDSKERYWLTIYGFLSYLYLLVVTFGISLFLLEIWLPLGLLALTMTIYSRVVSPIYKLLKHLRGHTTQGNRRRAVTVTAILASALVLFFGAVPFRDGIKTNGVVEARSSVHLYIKTPGRLERLAVSNGQWVKRGDLIAQFVNPDLESDIAASQAAKKEALAIYRAALGSSEHELRAIQEKIDGLDAQIDRLVEQQKELNVRSESEGKWVAPDLHQYIGSWLRRDQVLGDVVDPSNFKFYAIVPQEEADMLFKGVFKSVEVRLTGQAATNLEVRKLTAIPFQHDRLPSVALGWLGGGDVAVDAEDPDGKKAKEPFFLVQADLAEDAQSRATVIQGLSGTLRFALEDRPLAHQVLRSLKQLIQKRYNI